MYIHSTIITKSNSNNGNDNQRFRFRLPVPRLFRHFVLKSINLEFSLFSAWTSMSLENLGVYLNALFFRGFNTMNSWYIFQKYLKIDRNSNRNCQKLLTKTINV